MDPVGAALNLARGIAERAEKVKTNSEDCKLLASLASSTLPLLQHLEHRETEDPILTDALDAILWALEAAEETISKCNETSVFVCALKAEEHSQLLKVAAQKLEHAISRLPIATLGLTTEMHGTVQAIKEEFRQAKFQQQAVAHRNVQILRAELERAFKSDRRENAEGIEVLIREMFEELCELEEDRWKDLEILKAHLVDARKNKEAQEVFELQQIIEVVSESLQKTGPQPSVNTSPAKVFECPIGLAIMEDPVVLVDSGMTYERDNILEWMRRGNRQDPMTKADIKTGQLIPNWIIKEHNQLAYGSTRQTSTDLQVPSERLLVPGVYEGCGYYSSRDEGADYMFLVLILEPSGNIQGYFMSKFHKEPKHLCCRPIISGAWTKLSCEIAYQDLNFLNRAKITFDSNVHTLAFSLHGRGVEDMSGTKHEPPSGEVFYPCLCSPSLTMCHQLLPGLFEMEGTIQIQGSDGYASKLVLVLKANGGIRGWMSRAESWEAEFGYGRILSGSWRPHGEINFELCFSHLSDALVDSEGPQDFFAKFRFSGDIEAAHGASSFGCPVFAGTCRRVPDAKRPEHDSMQPLLGLQTNGFAAFRYNQIRRSSQGVSNRCHDELQLLRLPNEPGRYVEPGHVIIRAANQDGGGDYVWSFLATRYYTFDKAPPLKNGGSVMWHSTGYRSRWVLKDAGRPQEFYISILAASDSDSCAAGSYLTVAPRKEFARNHGKSKHYAYVDPREDHKLMWKLTYVDCRIIACVSPNNHPRFTELAGLFIAKQNMEQDYRDQASCFVTLSSDRGDAAELGFFYV